MKNIFVAVLFSVLFSCVAFAANKSTVQYSRQKAIQSIGGQFGLSVSDLTLSNTSSKTGILVGASVNMFKMGNVMFETGLQYKQMGTSQTNSWINLNYLVFPLAVKYYFLPHGNSVSLYGKGGLLPAIAVSKTAVAKEGGGSTDLKNTNTLDLGLLFAAGTEIELSQSVSLTFEIDYTRGLGAINEKEGYGNAAINNVGFAFLGGALFNL